jgi:hypothetical protein
MDVDMENARGGGAGEEEIIHGGDDKHNHRVVVIEPTELNSRIRMSASLQKQSDDGMDEEEEGGDDQQQQQQPVFPRLSAVQAANGRGRVIEYRKVRCPPHRYTPLREHWEQILTPLVDYLKLQVRATNRKTRTNAFDEFKSAGGSSEKIGAHDEEAEGLGLVKAEGVCVVPENQCKPILVSGSRSAPVLQKVRPQPGRCPTHTIFSFEPYPSRSI